MTSKKSHREAFLKAASTFESDFSSLDEMVSSKNTSNFNLSETLQTLTRKQHDALWESLHISTEKVLRELGAADSEDFINDKTPSLPALTTKLHAIATVAHAAVTALARMHPKLEEIVSILHKLLISLPESYHETCDVIAKTCTHWWKSNLPNRERYYPNLISYLLVKTQQTKKSPTPIIKEMYSIRQGLLDMDLSEEQSAFMKPFFLKLISNKYSFLKVKECSKFLSFMFSVHPSFVLDLHLAFLGVIPGAEKKVVEIYGVVYFTAWKNSTGVCREKIEYACIQDLLYKCILAHRTGPNAIFNTLNQLVSTFFSNKQQRGVDEMLYRLFKPFLWRFLTSTNPIVRSNAATLFFSAFPVKDPDLSRQELDETIQRQFDLIQELLKDPYSLVRNISVVSSLKLISQFWEFFPALVRKCLLTRLVTELAYDSNSVSVRTSVIHGLGGLLDNIHSHQTLETLLPHLSNHIHDASEQVRSALVDLLIKLKQLNAGISFWAVVPIEQLLARIEIDTTPIVLKIVALLMTSFLPVHKSADHQLSCVLSMLSNCSIVVARKFYSFANCYIPPGDIVKFILLITSSLKRAIEKSTDGENTNVNTTTQSVDVSQVSLLSVGADVSLNQSLISSPSMMQNLLEVLVCVWFSALESLTSEEHKKAYTAMLNKVSQAIPLFYNTFTEPPGRSAVLLLASRIPPEKMPALSYNPVEMVSLYGPTAKTEDYLPILICLVQWNKGKQLFKLFLESLDFVFSELKGKGRAKSRSEPKIAIGITLKMLETLFENPPSLQLIRKMEEMLAISKTLNTVTHSIETFIRRECDNTKLTVPILTSAFRIHTRLLAILSQDQEQETAESALGRLTRCLNWAVLLPSELTVAADATEIRITSRRKRKTMRDLSEVPLILPREMHDFIETLISDLVPLTADMSLIGLNSLAFLDAACQLNCEVAQVREFELFLPGVMRFLYNLIISFDYEDNLTHFGDLWDSACQIIRCTLKHIHNTSLTKSLPKQETSLLSQTIQMGIRHIERLKTAGNEESILDTSRINVHQFLITLSVCVNSILLSSIEMHLNSLNMNDTQMEIRAEVLPEFQGWVAKVVRRLNPLRLECTYQLEASGRGQTPVQSLSIKLCKKLFCLEK